VIDGDRTLPAVLAQAHRHWLAEFSNWHDFEPDDEFEPPDGITRLWRDWTANPAAEPAPFRVFGRDGTGGLAGFWLRQPDAPLEDQPIVFLGSEGEIAVIAENLGDYLWLLASGVGPLETVHGPEEDPEPIPVLVALAQRHTGITERPAEAVTATARTLVPELTAFIESVCRYAD
jgi:hypothetical protein